MGLPTCSGLIACIVLVSICYTSASAQLRQGNILAKRSSHDVRSGALHTPVSMPRSLTQRASFHEVQLSKRNRLQDTQAANVLISIAAIPQQYSKMSLGDGWAFNALGDITDIDQNLWKPRWDLVDEWWINQLNISPLRTHDDEAADIVFVPATLRATDVETVQGFFQNAQEFLPLLGNKPHVVVMDHPMDFVKRYHKQFFEDHKHLIRQFYIVSPEGFSRDWDIDWTRIIGTPFFGSVHWHRGLKRSHDLWNAAEILKTKKHLVMYSGVVRHYPVRYRFHADCMESGENCIYIDWLNFNRSRTELAKTTHKTMHESWYTLMPIGDNMLRNAFYDALMASCIPVMSEPDFADFCPYNDVITYSDFVDVAIPAEGGNVVTHLNNTFNKSTALGRLRRLQEVQRVLQYSLNPVHEVIRFDNLHAISSKEDAFTYTWKAVLRRICSQGLLPQRCSQVPTEPQKRSNESDSLS